MLTTNPKVIPMAHEFIARLSGTEINRLALDISQQIVDKAKYMTDYYHRYYLKYSYSDRYILALVIRNIFWEVKEFGHIQTHPEDLLRRANRNFDAYDYREYPSGLIFLCRAFARQFDDFDNFSRREFHCECDTENWLVEDYSCTAIRRYYRGRWFSVERVYSHDEFGKNKELLGYYVCENLYGWLKFKNEDGSTECIDVDEHYKVVPFDTEDEAKFFIVQLADMLNTDVKPRLIKRGNHYVDTDEKDYVSQAAAQWILDTLSQAPIEETRMREEAEAKARAEQLERERIAAEKARIAAEKRAKREKELSKGGYRVYVLQLEFNIIKIGISSNMLKRTSDIEGGGLKILKYRCTQPMTKGESRKIEYACHQHFRNRRKQREYFYVPYDEGCEKLQTFVDQPLIEVQLHDNS